MDGWKNRLPFGMALGHVHVTMSIFRIVPPRLSPLSSKLRKKTLACDRQIHEISTQDLKKPCLSAKKKKKNVLNKTELLGKWFHDISLSMFGNCWNLLYHFYRIKSYLRSCYISILCIVKLSGQITIFHETWIFLKEGAPFLFQVPPEFLNRGGPGNTCVESL